jgi:hypothetical protein
MKRKIYPDGKVVCPEQLGMVDVEECEQCPFYSGIKYDEYKYERYVICHL